MFTEKCNEKVIYKRQTNKHPTPFEYKFKLKSYESEHKHHDKNELRFQPRCNIIHKWPPVRIIAEGVS